MTDDWYGPDAATFGDRLAAARENAGMTQDDLARKTGVKPKSIRSWEEDHSDPRANRLMQLAGVLGVSISWLLHGEGEGIDAPDVEDDTSADIAHVLTELRTLRTQTLMQAEQIGRLEKRLRKMQKSANT